jgi:RNA polymerase sigma-70 factor (ECF subfamily)
VVLFAEIAEKYYDRLFAYCNSILMNHSMAEDACHDVLIKLLGHYEKGDQRCRHLRWILAVARNHCYDMIRKESRSVASDTIASTEKTDIPNPEKKFIMDEACTRIRKQLSSIPPQYREVLVLRDFNDMSYREIAEHLNCKTKQVKWMLSSARSMMRDGLGDIYDK